MTIISTSKARTMLPKFIENLKENDGVFVIGRRNQPEAILIKFPTFYRKDTTEITNINSYSSVFDFLNKEKEIYSLSDLK